MAGVFDAKHFNAEVFQKYVERIPPAHGTAEVPCHSSPPRTGRFHA